MLKKLVIAAGILATVVLIGCSSPPAPPLSPPLISHTSNVVNGTITVKAGSYTRYIVPITSQMQNVLLAGTFTAAGGSGKDIRVIFLDDLNLTNWSNGHAAKVLYDSGQTTVQQPSVRITTPGSYNLVFDNTFSTITEKTVTTRFDLTWQAP